MKLIKKIIKEELNKILEKPLYIFDFDETLIRDTEWHHDEIIDPVLFEDHLALLKQHENNAVILTARDRGEPIVKFMHDHGYDVPVYAVGIYPDPDHVNKNAIRKRDWIANAIDTLGLTYVEFWDDTPENIILVNELQKEKPDVVIKTHLVVRD